MGICVGDIGIEALPWRTAFAFSEWDDEVACAWSILLTGNVRGGCHFHIAL